MPSKNGYVNIELVLKRVMSVIIHNKFIFWKDKFYVNKRFYYQTCLYIYFNWTLLLIIKKKNKQVFVESFEKKTQFLVIYDWYRFAGYFEGIIDAFIRPTWLQNGTSLIQIVKNIYLKRVGFTPCFQKSNRLFNQKNYWFMVHWFEPQ